MMTKLNGSPKQIAWAEKIRAQKIAEVVKIVDEFENHKRGTLTDGSMICETLTSEAQSALANLRSYDDAEFWIDRRWRMGVSIKLDVVLEVRLADAGMKVIPGVSIDNGAYQPQLVWEIYQSIVKKWTTDHAAELEAQFNAIR